MPDALPATYPATAWAIRNFYNEVFIPSLILPAYVQQENFYLCINIHHVDDIPEQGIQTFFIFCQLRRY